MAAMAGAFDSSSTNQSNAMSMNWSAVVASSSTAVSRVVPDIAISLFQYGAADRTAVATRGPVAPPAAAIGVRPPPGLRTEHRVDDADEPRTVAGIERRQQRCQRP